MPGRFQLKGAGFHMLPRARVVYATICHQLLHQGHPCMTARTECESQQTVSLKPAPLLVKNGDILDVDEAAALLKISQKTVYNRVKANTIPHDSLGRKLLFHRQSLVQGIADGANRANQVRRRTANPGSAYRHAQYQSGQGGTEAVGPFGSLTIERNRLFGGCCQRCWSKAESILNLAFACVRPALGRVYQPFTGEACTSIMMKTGLTYVPIQRRTIPAARGS